MRIRIGHEITLDCAEPTPLICLLTPHPDRQGDLTAPERRWSNPDLPVETYVDGFGNICRRMVAPVGKLTIGADAIVNDSGAPDPVEAEAGEVPLDQLPPQVLQFLIGSRYVETDLLSPIAWDLFGRTPRGWARVQAIADFVHGHIAFDYANARATRTALEAFGEKTGVCRDFAHLTLGFCRAMNIPARYVNGYLGDIGVPAVPDPMDFSAWCEVFLGGRWYSFDARHNRPRIGRIVVARGRDAADVPLINSFGPHKLAGFRVWTDEVTGEASLGGGEGSAAGKPTTTQAA